MSDLLFRPMRVFLALCLISLPYPLPAQADSSGRLDGTVTTSDRGLLRGAIVQVQASVQRTARTDSLGRFAFDALPPGSVAVVVRAIGYPPWRAAAVRVLAQRTTRLDVTLVLDSAMLVKQRDVWLGCAASRPEVECVLGRRLIMKVPYPSPVSRVFVDSGAFAAFWEARYYPTNSPTPPAIDWRSEIVVGIAFGAYSSCDHRRYINRVESTSAVTTVVLGPDSVYVGPPEITCMAVRHTMDMRVLQRRGGRIVFERANRAWLSDSVARSVRDGAPSGA